MPTSSMQKQKKISTSQKETIEFAKRLAEDLKPGSVICLKGDLGAGKTTFVKGIASGLGLKNLDEVKSPTFVIMHIYETSNPLYHFDFYRLQSVEELDEIGFEEFLANPNGICCIEWPEKAEKALPNNVITVKMSVKGESERSIEIS